MATKRSPFDGKLALVTGGSSGIGLALARLLAADGARVWILARRPAQLQAALSSLASANGNKPGMLAADVTKLDQVQSAVERLKQEAGVPDLLINAVGGSRPGYLQDTGLDVYRQMMELNYFGTVQMVQAWLPDMLKRRSGHIVNFASIAAFWAPFGYVAYAPAKFAVRGFSDALRLEVKPLGLRVSLVYPPDTDTPGMENENKTKPFETHEAFSTKLVSPHKVAQAILRSLKRRQYVILPGFEADLYYRLMYLVGNGIYPIFDMMLDQAQRKKAKVKGG
jgi:3-dehydrosphinganine reductase